MRRKKYVGTFVSSDGDTFQLTTHCNGYIQALILLTADAINQGKHYQLSTISDEKDNVKQVDDILKIGNLIY